mgnify:CR=1 FL=1
MEKRNVYVNNKRTVDMPDKTSLGTRMKESYEKIRLPSKKKNFYFFPTKTIQLSDLKHEKVQ